MEKKMKAFTISFDDGVLQDKRLIGILDKYGLKCTFNLNSGLFATGGAAYLYGTTVCNAKPRVTEIKKIYQNHEVAVHTVSHPQLADKSDDEIAREVEQDRELLSAVVGYDVVGMAYPYGLFRDKERVTRVLRERTGVKYSRTTNSSFSFDMPKEEELIELKPTLHVHCDFDRMEKLADEFIALKPDTPKMFYIWGHAYEFDIRDDWDRFEKFCAKISGKDDIFYGTNTEVLLGDWDK